MFNLVGKCCTPYGQFCNIGGNENLIDLPVGYFQVFFI